MATKYTFNYSDITKSDFSLYSYTSNGPVSPSDGTLISNAVAQDTTLKLYGKGMPDYGEGITQNLIYLLENFAMPSPGPINPIEGQQWYNNVGIQGSPTTPIGKQLNIYNGNAWEAVILASGTSQMTDQLVLADLNYGSPGGSPSVSDLAAVPKKYVEAHMIDDSLHITVTQNTLLDALVVSADEINMLVGINGTGSPLGSPYITIQNQLDAKISRTGDTMSASANLTFNGGNVYMLSGGTGSPVAGNIIFSGGEVIGLPAIPSATGATSKEYVDSAITAGADGTLTSIDWTADIGSPTYVATITDTDLELTVTYPIGSPVVFIAQGVSRLGHGHAATEITFDDSGVGYTGTTVQAAMVDIDSIKANLNAPVFPNGLTIIGSSIVTGNLDVAGYVTAYDPINSDQLATKNYVDSTAFTGVAADPVTVTRHLEITGSPLTFGSPIIPYSILEHLANDNKLSITINGIKQYAHVYGSQQILYDINVGLITSATFTGLDSTKIYDFNIAIDGGATTTITIPAASSILTHDDLANTINGIMMGSPELAQGIYSIESIVSNTSGGTSSVLITDPGAGSPDSIYLFSIDGSPTTIDSADFFSSTPFGGGSPITPDNIIINGDVTALFPIGKTFTIRGSNDANYGTYDGVYSVHVNGPVVSGSPQITSIPIGWLNDYTLNTPLYSMYSPGGSPAATPPAPAPWGSVHFTPLGGFDQLATPIDGINGQYAETDINGDVQSSGSTSNYVVFNYSIPSGEHIESVLIA